MTGRIKARSTMLEELNRALRDEAQRLGTQGLDADQTVSLLMRNLKPYLRNRYSVIDATTPDDELAHRMRVHAVDHADGSTMTIGELADTLIDGVPVC